MLVFELGAAVHAVLRCGIKAAEVQWIEQIKSSWISADARGSRGRWIMCSARRSAEANDEGESVIDG